MFKVSLLPSSYRKFLEGKKKKDLVLRVALVILVSMLIIYSGFAIRLFILKAQLREVNQNNAMVSQQIEELQQYKNIYDNLIASKKQIDSIKGKTPSAVKVMSLIQTTKPEYVKYTVVSVQEWTANPICIIEGTLPTAKTMGDAVDQLRDLENYFNTEESFKGIVNKVVVTNSLPEVKEDAQGNETYSFRIYLACGGSVIIDSSGALVTTTTTAPSTETETIVAAEGDVTTTAAASENGETTSTAEETTSAEAAE